MGLDVHPGHWWAAASGQVGPAPLLAPAVLAQIGLCVLLACWAHPAVRSAGPRPVPEVSDDQRRPADSLA